MRVAYKKSTLRFRSDYRIRHELAYTQLFLVQLGYTNN